MLVVGGAFQRTNPPPIGPDGWAVPIIIVAVLWFLSEVAITYGQIVARRFQREIDELAAMMKDAP
ncbi:MAG: hypothetical protein WDM77_03550 [Steroidobacteraceae bacterium]